MRHALALTLLLLVPATGAEECTPSTSRPEIDTGETPAGRYYYDCSAVLAAYPCVTWTVSYRESNGIDGLQRNDDLWDDTCGGTILPDTLLTET